MMEFSSGLFRDVDQFALDYDQHVGYIIPRVWMRGTMDDIVQIVQFYGAEKVKQILQQTRYLDPKSLAFAAWYFTLPRESLRCYTLKQSTPRLWTS